MCIAHFINYNLPELRAHLLFSVFIFQSGILFYINASLHSRCVFYYISVIGGEQVLLHINFIGISYLISLTSTITYHQYNQTLAF